MLSNSLYYKESGIIPSAAPIRMIIVGGLTAFLVGAMYAYAIFYIPFIYLNLFITLAYGGIVGFAVGASAKSAKVRHEKFVLLIGALVGIFAVYTAWIFSIHALYNTEVLLFNPIEIAGVIAALAEEGYWTIFETTPTGAALYTVWGLEALTLVGMSTIAAVAGHGTTPFCEHCQVWCAVEELSTNLAAPENIEKFISSLEGRDFDVLTDLRNNEGYNSKKMKVEILDCPSCKKTHYLNITLISIITDEKDQQKEESTLIVENLTVNAHVYDQLMEWSRQLNVLPTGRGEQDA